MLQIAVPDVHGDVHALRAVCERASKVCDPAARFVFLGDFIDRGMFSADVLRYIKKMTEAGHLAIRGNHEELLLQFMQQVGDDEFYEGELRFGLDTTIESFEADWGKPIATGLDLRHYLKQSGFGAWIEALPYHYRADGISFSHAAVPQEVWDLPQGPDDDDHCWPKPAGRDFETLDEFMGAPEGHIAVCGHVVMEPHHGQPRMPMRVEQGVYLDCGCGSREDGWLVAGLFESGQHIGYLTADERLPVDAYD